MKKSNASGIPTGSVVFVVCLFVAVLAGCIVIQLLVSSDFSGFGGLHTSEPAVNYVPPDGTELSGRGEEGPYSWEDHPVFVIGDSLTQGARKDISNAVAGATVDGKVNRNMSDGLKILMDWDASGILTDDAVIVVCLAHNITGSTLGDAEQIVNMIRPGQSLIMMTGHGLSDMAPINEYIRGLPLEYNYITVADWDLTIAQSPGLLADDGIHIRKKQGNELYANLILSALDVTRPMQW